MAAPELGWRARLGGALRLLTGRGDDAVACSFCGRTRTVDRDIVAGPGVAICTDCAHVALSCSHADRLARAHGSERPRFLVSFILDPGEQLSNTFLARIETTLSDTVGEHGCELASWYIARAMPPAKGDYLALDAYLPALPEGAPEPDASALQEVIRETLRLKLSLPRKPDG